MTLNELKNKYQESNIDSVQLDITDKKSINNAVSFVEKKYESLSVLFNNAGIKNKKQHKDDEERILDIKTTFYTNYFSQISVVDKFLPLIRKNRNRPHIIFSNGFVGKRTFNDKEKNNKLENADLSVLEQMYLQFINDTREGKVKNWDYKYTKVSFAYGISKMFLNAYMRSLAAKLENEKIMVNSFNPGWCKTDMGGSTAPMTVEEGVLCAKYVDSFGLNTELGFQTGKIYENCKIFEY